MDRCNCREKERKGALCSRHSRMYALDFEEAEKNVTIFTPSYGKGELEQVFWSCGGWGAIVESMVPGLPAIRIIYSKAPK